MDDYLIYVGLAIVGIIAIVVFTSSKEKGTDMPNTDIQNLMCSYFSPLSIISTNGIDHFSRDIYNTNSWSGAGIIAHDHALTGNNLYQITSAMPATKTIQLPALNTIKNIRAELWFVWKNYSTQYTSHNKIKNFSFNLAGYEVLWEKVNSDIDYGGNWNYISNGVQTRFNNSYQELTCNCYENTTRKFDWLYGRLDVDLINKKITFQCDDKIWSVSSIIPQTLNNKLEISILSKDSSTSYLYLNSSIISYMLR